MNVAVGIGEEGSKEAILAKMAELRRGATSAENFWRQYLDGVLSLVGGTQVVLLVAVRDEEKVEWRVQSMRPEPSAEKPPARDFMMAVAREGDACAEQGKIVASLRPAAKGQRGAHVVGVRLMTVDNDPSPRLAMVLVEGRSDDVAAEQAMRLLLVRDVPASYLAASSASGVAKRVEAFASTMDLMTQVNREDRFLSAAMLVCNELAGRHRCSRVSIGWRKGNYVRLKAMSQTERFEKRMDAVAELEKVMEECLDQDEEVVIPRPDKATYVSRDHEQFARAQGAVTICSVPLRDVDDAVMAVMVFEWSEDVANEALVRHLRLTADQIAPRIDELYRRDRWFGARAAAATKRGLGKIFGFDHTWTKLGCVLVAGLLAFLCLYRMEYRVEAPFVIESREVRFVPAPFDGYVSDVSGVIGQRVEKGDVLVKMDVQDLLLERSSAVAERNRYVREMEKARGEKQLAQMQISEALAEQQRIKIDELDWRLEQAVLKAPMSGIIVRAGSVSGELHERINAPLSRGDLLVKIASMEDLYVGCRIDEQDIEHVAMEAITEIAFASQPDLKYVTVLAKIDPAATPTEEGNRFHAECTFSEPPPGWVRPGMTGICKVNAGERSLIWIFTHRTIDFLRMFFWW
jgi:hypothetical protein